eukprot:scaffold29784_cov55-Phaeocystis_antarctica.AAC.5
MHVALGCTQHCVLYSLELSERCDTMLTLTVHLTRSDTHVSKNEKNPSASRERNNVNDASLWARAERGGAGGAALREHRGA